MNLTKILSKRRNNAVSGAFKKPITPTKMKAPFLYQERMIAAIEKIYATYPNDQRAFLQMPTGTGKTFTALCYTIQKLRGTKPKEVVWVAHQIQLLTQSGESFFEDFKAQGGKYNKENGIGKIANITFRFMTWQSFRNEKNFSTVDMLVVDEAHQGSSDQQGQTATDGKNRHKSFKTIVVKSKIKIQLYVTATPWNLNHSIFGGLLNSSGNVKSDRVALITLQEAKNANPPMISNVEFRVFSSADTLLLKDLDSGEEESVESDTQEELIEKVLEKKVNVKAEESKNALKRSTLFALLDAFFRSETKNGKKLPPTIVFCQQVKSNKNPFAANKVIAAIQAKATDVFGHAFDTGEAFVHMVHSQSGEIPSNVLEAFSKGKYNILCVVGMASEGFNYEGLEVAIDLVPCLSNRRKLMQKLGRLARYVPGKTSRYYYADCIKNYIKVNGHKHELSEEVKSSFIEELMKTSTLASDDVFAVAEAYAGATIAAAGLDQADSGLENVQINSEYLGSETFEEDQTDGEVKLIGNRKKRGTLTSVGYIIRDAHNEKGNYERFQLFNMIERKDKNEDGLQIELLELARAKGTIPSDTSLNPNERLLGKALTSYINKGKKYCANFDAIIRHIAPSWFVKAQKAAV